jgi:hypothetical protein
MLTFILATWSLVGIISGLILSKLDCTTVRVKDIVAFAILGYTIIPTVIWGELVDRVFKSNPTVIDFKK